MTTDLPDYDPHLLEKQIAIVREMQRRGWYSSSEESERQIERLQAEDNEQRRKFIDAGYRKFDIPQLEREFHEMMARKQHLKLSKTRRWIYPWNLEPPEDMPGLVAYWNIDPEKERAKQRKQAAPSLTTLHEIPPEPLEWLWPARLPRGKVSLLTGGAGEGKSLVALDVIARVTTGREWPDGAAGDGPGDVLCIFPETGLQNVISPRLQAAGADLTRLRLLSAVTWEDPQTGETQGEPFRLPDDGLRLEAVLEQAGRWRLVVIDPLSEFLGLPPAASERAPALHDILSDLEDLAEKYDLTLLCVESARPGGVIGTPANRDWRAHYDSHFQSVWGVARDPRDRGRRLLLPIRHHLGDDREGLQFSISSDGPGAARIEWGEPEDAISYAEATGRVRLGRSIWSFSQTADAETWLRDYLKEGEKPSVEIFREAQELGYTEYPVREALRRVATKFKQKYQGEWLWKLKETGQNPRVSSNDLNAG